VSFFHDATGLWHTVRPNLLALYQTRIGIWELKLLQVVYRASSLKRTLELALAAINQNQKPDWLAIKELVDAEGRDWQKRTREATERIKQAEGRLSSLVPDRVHRQIAQMQSAPPFSLQKELADEEWVARKRREIEDQTETWRAKLEGYWRQLQALRHPHESHEQFGDN